MSCGVHVMTSYDPLVQNWVVAGNLLTNVNAMLFLVEIEQFWNEFRGDLCHA